MGLTLTAKYKDAPEWDMGYGSFFRLRRDVAYTISKEFGEHYADITWGSFHQEEYDEITNILLRKYHVSNRLIFFLYSPDCEARISPLRCKAVYDQIEGTKNNFLYGYTARPNACMTWEDFKCMLKECYERKTYMYWY